LWYAEQENWSDDARLLTKWHVREFLGYVGGEVNRWGVAGNGSESSSSKASPRTVHHYYRALHSFFIWAVKEGFLADNPVAAVKVAKPKRRVIKPYSLSEIQALLSVCHWDYQHNAKFLGSRNCAIVLVLLDTGLRLSELANMTFADMDTERGWIKVVGKGSKERVVRIGKTAQKSLWRYLIYRPDNARPEIWLTEEGKPLHGPGIQSMIDRLKRRAGINEKGRVHRFRYTFGLNFLRADGNPFNLRDRLLIRILFKLGCRISEALGIGVEDIDFAQGTITIEHLKARIRFSCPRCSARLGKAHAFCPSCGTKVDEALTQEQQHRRVRTLPIDRGTLEMLDEYVRRGEPISREGRVLLFGINRHRAWQVVRDSAKKASLPDLVNSETGRRHGISPHRLRDAFAVHAVKIDDSGDGLRLLQEHLGHASFNTTARYRKVAGEEHRQWYERLWRKGGELEPHLPTNSDFAHD